MKSNENWLLTATCLLVIGLLPSQAQTSSFSKKNDPARYEYQLSQLNIFLEDFDDGNSGQVAVEDDFIIIRYPEGQYCKFKMEDMADPVLDTRWGQINWDCKNESMCVETDWNEDGQQSGVLFSELGSISLSYLMDLLKDFITAYKGR